MKRNCPKCGKTIHYKCKKTLYDATRRNTQCKHCCKLGIRNGYYGKFTTKPYESLYKRLVRCAKYKGIKCQLTYEQFVEFTKNPICQYCGEPVSFKKHLKHIEKSLAYNIDRRDSTGPYSIDNCQVLCYSCNILKYTTTENEFFKKIKKIYEHKNIRDLFNN
jgi:5-methylcytosine-specific restriction endonuclease McrA